MTREKVQSPASKNNNLSQHIKMICSQRKPLTRVRRDPGANKRMTVRKILIKILIR